MFTRFMVATDLSQASFGVVRCLGGLKAYGAKECLLLQCLSLQEVSSVALSYSTETLKKNLQAQKEILEKQGFLVETRSIPGFGKSEINRVAMEENYSLIVSGSQSHSLLGELFLGGIGDDLIHYARKPALILRLEEKPGEGEACIKPARCDFGGHILFPTDFSENADHAFTYVENLLADRVRRITLFHVQDKVRIDPHLKDRLDEFNEIDRNRLEKMKLALQKKGTAEINIEVCYGHPFAEIKRFISESDVNLVVMGSQGRGYLAELFLGSLSHAVVYHSEVAVLLIPAYQEEA